MRARLLAPVLFLSAALLIPAAASAQPQTTWTARGDFARAAHRVSDRARELYQTLRSVEGYGHLSADARRMYATAERLHREIEGGAPQQYVFSSYYQFLEDLRHMRVALFRAHEAHHYTEVSRSWARLVGANELFAITLGVPGEAVCRGGEGPYYGPHERPPVPVRPRPPYPYRR